jgi:hypothetical protein
VKSLNRYISLVEIFPISRRSMNNRSEAHIKKGEDKVQIPNALQALDLFQQGNSPIRTDVTELFDHETLTLMGLSLVVESNRVKRSKPLGAKVDDEEFHFDAVAAAG